MATAQPTPQRLARVLGLFEAFSLVVSAVLGTSIFLVPSAVAAQVPFFAGIAGVWIAGGLFSLAGALTYAELAAMLPEAGGGYVYLGEAFGPLASFLFVWTDCLLVRPGAAAAISVGFAAYALSLFPAPAGVAPSIAQACLAIVVILVIGLLNVLGTKLSGSVQVAGTIFKAGALLLLISLPFWFATHVHSAYLQPILPAKWTIPTWQGLGAGMVAVFWSYGGWDQLSHMAEEVRSPEKNLARAFGWGLATVTMLFVGASVAIHSVFTIAQVARSQAIGSDYFSALLGPVGAILIAAVVFVAAITSAHMALMSGSRACFAIARSGSFPAALARLHPRFGTPANSVLALTFWSCVLVAGNAFVAVGSRPLYVVLFTYVMFGLLLFTGLIYASAIRLRMRHPEWKRPYRVWAYPFTPLAGIAVNTILLLSMLINTRWEALSAAAIILLGCPLYWLASKNAKHVPPPVRA